MKKKCEHKNKKNILTAINGDMFLKESTSVKATGSKNEKKNNCAPENLRYIG